MKFSLGLEKPMQMFFFMGLVLKLFSLNKKKNLMKRDLFYKWFNPTAREDVVQMTLSGDRKDFCQYSYVAERFTRQSS